MLLATCNFLDKFTDNRKRKIAVFKKFYFKIPYLKLSYTVYSAWFLGGMWWNFREQVSQIPAIRGLSSEAS